MTISPDLLQLASGRCVPEDGDYRLLALGQLDGLNAMLPDEWRQVESHLEACYRFDDFAQSLNFTNLVAAMAEQQNHHPRLVLEWGSVTVQIWTHLVDGLAQGDFVFAAKVVLLADELAGRNSTHG